MGIISSIAKGTRTAGIKKDAALKNISDTTGMVRDKFSDVKNSTAIKYQEIKGNVLDPKAFLKKQWDAGKMQAELTAQQKKEFGKTLGNFPPKAQIPSSLSPSLPSSSPASNEELAKDQDKLVKEELKKLRGHPEGNEDKYLRIYLGILVGFAILIHIWDIASGLSTVDGAVITLYITYLVVVFLLVSKGHFDSNFEGMVVPVIVAYIFPRVVGYSTKNWIAFDMGRYFNAILVIMPVLVIYLLWRFPEHSIVNKLSRLYITLIVFTLIAIFLTSSMASFFWSGTNSEKLIKNPWSSIKDFFNLGASSFAKLGTNIGTSWNRMIASATGQPYEGDEQSVNGIFLTGIKALDEGRLYTNRNIILNAKLEIRTANLEDQTEFKVVNKCYEQNADVFSVTPETVIMSGNDWKDIRCTTPNLRAGGHTIVFASNFDYYTEGTIQYWFIDRNKFESSYTNLNNVPMQTTAVYSGGPVELGLKQYYQPMKIDSSHDATYQFGISLNNKWTAGSGSGKITRGDKFMLEVPNVVTLKDCTRNIVSQTDTPDQTTQYFFSIKEEALATYFDSVECVMEFNDASTWLNTAPGEAIELTFKGAAWYNYELRQEKSITVEEFR